MPTRTRKRQKWRRASRPSRRKAEPVFCLLFSLQITEVVWHSTGDQVIRGVTSSPHSTGIKNCTSSTFLCLCSLLSRSFPPVKLFFIYERERKKILPPFYVFIYNLSKNSNNGKKNLIYFGSVLYYGFSSFLILSIVYFIGFFGVRSGSLMLYSTVSWKEIGLWAAPVAFGISSLVMSSCPHWHSDLKQLKRRKHKMASLLRQGEFNLIFVEGYLRSWPIHGRDLLAYIEPPSTQL